MKVVVSAILVVCMFSTFGCYNTYYVSRQEFSKLQNSTIRQTTLNTLENQKILVTWNTRVYARSKGGKRYQVTPFNFKLTDSQLVASDRDLLLEIHGLQSYEVDHFSTWKTVGWVALGLALAAGAIVGVVFTAGKDKGFGN